MDTSLRWYDGAEKHTAGNKKRPLGRTLSLPVAHHLEPLHHCEFNGGFLEFALPQVGIALGITDRQGRNKSPHVQFII